MSIWGRVIGGAAGFALGGPIGAILGFLAYNLGYLGKKRGVKWPLLFLTPYIFFNYYFFSYTIGIYMIAMLIYLLNLSTIIND